MTASAVDASVFVDTDGLLASVVMTLLTWGVIVFVSIVILIVLCVFGFFFFPVRDISKIVGT